jgi:hypothetical protein
LRLSVSPDGLGAAALTLAAARWPMEPVTPFTAEVSWAKVTIAWAIASDIWFNDRLLT